MTPPFVQILKNKKPSPNFMGGGGMASYFGFRFFARQKNILPPFKN